MSDETNLLAALTGSASSGSYPDTVLDRLDKALAAAWNLSAGLNIAAPVSGSDPGPYRSDAQAWDGIVDQTTARYGAAPKARTLVEKAQLLEALIKGIDAHRTSGSAGGSGGGGDTTGSGTGTTTGEWAALPVLTSSGVTSANDSHQSAVPSFQSDGMHVRLPSSGGSPGPGASAASGSYQRCEAYVAGWGNLTGTLFLRYDFTLLGGFPTSTGTWQTIAQCKNSSTGSPPLELMVGSKSGRNAVYLQWHSAGGSETGTEIICDATTDVKHSVVLEVPFTTGNASVSAWHNGAVAFSGKAHGGTLYSGQSSYGKIGTYRDAAVGKTSEIVFHGVAKGSTLASVTG
jgi:hypothetical protein